MNERVTRGQKKEEYPTALYKALGERIAIRRKERGLTQPQAAHELGISRETLACYEGGTTYPPLHRVYEIAAVLKCDVARLIPLEICLFPLP